MAHNINNFYSQRGEDNFLIDNYEKFFNYEKKYKYLDIGSADAEINSNTRVFDFFNNWSGLCFEPNPIYDDTYLKTNRNRIKKAVTPNNTGTVNFDLHPISEIGKIGGNEIVESISAKDLFLSFGDFDLISIDVEGFEYDIIKELLLYFKPSIIIAEYNTLGKYDFRLLNYIINKYDYELIHITEFNFIYFK